MNEPSLIWFILAAFGLAGLTLFIILMTRKLNKPKLSKRVPECAHWDVWFGYEVEGTVERRQETIFIRRLRKISLEEVHKGHPHVYRVWFCKEFRDFVTIRRAFQYWSSVCLEVTYDELELIPEDLRRDCRVYLKIDFKLKRGDQVCVGSPYRDEAFEIGKGVAVSPSQYNQDIQII